MNAGHFREKLIAYLDGELDEAESVKLQAHLKECCECRRELQALKETLAFTSLDAPLGFAGVEWKPSAGRRTPWWRWMLVPAAAAFLLVIFAGDVDLRRIDEAGQEWLVVEGDSLSVDQGLELAGLLLAEDEKLLEGLKNYEETIPVDIYIEIYELSEEEGIALIGLLEEVARGTERS